MAKSPSSGGMGAIFSTFKHAQKRTGLIRAAQALPRMNKSSGFDCPGCAWPEPKNRSAFEFCENGAKTLMEATTKKAVDSDFFKRHSIAELLDFSDHALTAAGRLCQPVIKHPYATHFVPIDYTEAYTIAAQAFSSLSAPDRAVFYTSGRASNEAAFLYQLFARALSTNNLCDCSNLCHESSGVALKKTIGVGKGTVQIEDFLQAELIFLIGHNPSTNHPRMLSTLKEAKKNGAKIIVINPLVEPGLKAFRHPQKISDFFGAAHELATHYFQVTVGGDYPLFLAIAKKILADHSASVEQQFIDDYCLNFAHFKNSLCQFSYDELVKDTSLKSSEIALLAELIASHERVIYAWGMGITQTTYGVATIETIAQLALMRGHMGKPGAGVCPVRGHSNVQGNRTVGITEQPTPAFLQRLKEAVGFDPPTAFGLDVVDSIKAMLAGSVDIFMALGGNFLVASPDTQTTAHALKQCSLAINIATSLNKTHLIAGKSALLIPCLSRVEKDLQQGIAQTISVENSMSIVHASRGHFEPLTKNLPSEVTIVAQIAKACCKSWPVDWQALNDNYDLIRELIERCIDGFAPYTERLKNPDGFCLPNKASTREFPTQSGRAQFLKAVPYKKSLNKDYDLLLTTIRSHDQFNTSIYGYDDRYRGIKNDRQVVFMNELDIARLLLSAGTCVDLISHYDGVKRIAAGFKVHPYAITEGCAAAYFPEANVLVPLDSVALQSNTPTSKLIPISVQPHRSTAHGHDQENVRDKR